MKVGLRPLYDASFSFAMELVIYPWIMLHLYITLMCFKVIGPTLTCLLQSLKLLLISSRGMFSVNEVVDGLRGLGGDPAVAVA